MSLKRPIFLRTLMVVLAVLLTATSVSFAQPGRGGRGFMGGTRLLTIELVQKELELDEEQITEIKDLASGKRTVSKDEEKDAAPAERPNIREMSDEQRKAYFEKRAKEREEKRNGEESAIEEILLPHQSRRLEQIKVQLMGAQALSDSKVAEEVGIDEETKERMKEITRERMEEMRDVMRDVFRGGDRDEIQETMSEMRESIESAVVEVLNDTQKAKYKELKGPDLPFTATDLMGEMFRGRGRGGDRGDRGGRGGRDRGGRGERDAG